MSEPVFLIIAGVNGAGKSSLTASHPEILSSFPVLDPDAVARLINPANFEGSILSAGRQVLESAQDHLDNRRSFVVETTLSGRTYLDMARSAKDLGYLTCMIYVGLASADLSLARVKLRVEVGGHNVPEADIRRRYSRSLKNLKQALSLLDIVLLYDNSAKSGYEQVAIAKQGSIRWLASIPAWATHLA